MYRGWLSHINQNSLPTKPLPVSIYYSHYFITVSSGVAKVILILNVSRQSDVSTSRSGMGIKQFNHRNPNNPNNPNKGVARVGLSPNQSCAMRRLSEACVIGVTAC